jgi:methanogenic corrinoid protein MtbC1
MLEHQKLGYFINQNKDKIIISIIKQINNNRDTCFLGFETQDLREIIEYVHQDIGKLFTAIISERVSIFTKYLQWHKSVAMSRAIPQYMLVAYYQIFKSVLLEFVPFEFHSTLNKYLVEGDIALSENLEASESYLNPNSPTYNQELQYLNLVLGKKRSEAIDFVIDEIKNGLSLESVYLGVIQNVQYEIGRLWQFNKISVADEHFATETSKMIMNKILDEFKPKEKIDKKIVAVSMGAELHEMGIRLVHDYFAINGWNTVYLGSNITIPSVLNFICANIEKIDVLAISGTMSSEIYAIKHLIELIRNSPCNKLKIIVGGNVFNSNPELVNYVEADGFGRNPQEGLLVASSLVA